MLGHGLIKRLKISSFISEMWLKWHVILWETCPILDEIPGYDTLIPHKLFRPLKSVLVSHILQKTESVREYLAHMLELRVASHNIWHSSANVVKSHDVLLSAAHSLLQQIIYAHKKSFEDPTFANIRSAFHSIHRLKDTKESSIKNLVSLRGSSNHHVFTSLIDSLTEPLLNELYPEPLLNELYPLCPSDEQRIGYAWLRIGCLCYNLLICCEDLYPTVKYSIKYSELTEMIASLELEIQVRKECMYLAGSTPLGEASIFNRINLLERLNSERRILRRKETTSCFIDRLSNEYSAYLDVIEPVQATLYEMKLGLSFFVPRVLYKKCNANGEQNMAQCLSSSNEPIWNAANKYYFKSISSMQTLEQINQNFHEDFSLVQVQTSGSYVDHLLEIQQEQRSAAYRFAKQLKCLRQCTLRLSNLFSSSIHSAEDTINDFSFSNNQYPTFKCMWQQKQLFDGFYTMMYEAHLLLLTFENTHLSTCSTVKSGAEKIRLFIQKIRDDFRKSKDFLDCHLLGSNGNVAMNEIKLQPYGVTKEMELNVKRNFS